MHNGRQPERSITEKREMIPETIEHGDWKQTIDCYCFTMYEHAMRVADG